MMTYISDKDKVLTGDEVYEIYGCHVNHDKIIEIFKYFSGLNKYWNCIEKAIIAQKLLKSGQVVVGAMLVANEDFSATYGFHYNPPYEFHSWLQFEDNNTLDLSLPGVIEKGLSCIDSHGPILFGRKPIILNGTPPNWIRYEAHNTYAPNKRFYI